VVSSIPIAARGRRNEAKLKQLIEEQERERESGGGGSFFF